MSKDNVLTLPVPGSNLVFTRYLYIKDEVKIALLISVLNKSNDAIFWAYELLHSGFKYELFALFWKIYYDFFATLNPSFSSYLIKKQTEYFSTKEDRFISAIIQDLIIRPFNTDIFMMRQICELFETDAEIENSNKFDEKLDHWLKTEDYRSIACYILTNKDTSTDLDIYKYVLNWFKLTNQSRLVKDYLNAMISSYNSASNKIILLAHIMSIVSKNRNLIKGKNFYMLVEPEDVIQFETIESSDDLESYRILRNGCICGIDDQKYLNLFELVRNKMINLSDTYNDKWLYHASFSPIWFDRIKLYKGYVDYEHKQVKFISEDWEEDFYSRYGYEPDEQPLNVKNKSISNINRDNDWIKFYEMYKNNGLIDVTEEELEEMNTDTIVY
jgi:hypothetical protein